MSFLRVSRGYGNVNMTPLAMEEEREVCRRWRHPTQRKQSIFFLHCHAAWKVQDADGARVGKMVNSNNEIAVFEGVELSLPFTTSTLQEYGMETYTTKSLFH
jgi:hypothetical protein